MKKRRRSNLVTYSYHFVRKVVDLYPEGTIDCRGKFMSASSPTTGKVHLHLGFSFSETKENRKSILTDKTLDFDHTTPFVSFFNLSHLHYSPVSLWEKFSYYIYEENKILIKPSNIIFIYLYDKIFNCGIHCVLYI